MGNSQGTHITGNGHQELQFMLLHKLASNPVAGHEAQFYYNTVDKVFEIYDTTWKYIPKVVTAFIDQQLVIGNGYTLAPINAPVNTSFVRVDKTSVASTQEFITFEDILVSDYTTTITAPGVNTRFITEKAIVDYVTTLISAIPLTTAAGSNTQIQYNNLGVFGADSNFLWNKNTHILSVLGTNAYPPQLYLNNQLFLTGTITTLTLSVIDEGTHVISSGGIFLDAVSNVEINALYSVIIDTPSITINQGTPSTWLTLDAGKNLTYSTFPASFINDVTPGIFNLGVLAGIDGNTLFLSPYTVSTIGKFDDSVTAPISVTTTLNYNGMFRSTQLFEGATRVMTSHGNQAANSGFHTIANTTYSGFMPVLPASLGTNYYLRGDATWASTVGLNYWVRTGTTLSPVVANDILSVSSTGISINGVSTISTGVKGTSNSNTGVFGTSNTSAGVLGLAIGTGTGVVAQSVNGIAISGLVEPASTNSVVNTLLLSRQTSGTAANGIGQSIDFTLETITSSAIASQVITKWVDAAHATRTSSFEWWLTNLGTLANKMELTGAGELITTNQKITGLAVYANNVEALAGGLVAGQLYRTGTGGLMITYTPT
jgi:hypothetical protein